MGGPTNGRHFVTDRIKALKKTICGVKCEDNLWTALLREKLHHDTVKDKPVGDRTFKTNQQWVSQTPMTNRDGPPKWSWFGVLFSLAPFGLLSGRAEYPTVWVCDCTQGYRKVYEQKTYWSVTESWIT